MRELKFTCPSCGQHIQCGLNCADQNIPCPACASLIRVPANAVPTDVTSCELETDLFQPPDESTKVSYARAETAKLPTAERNVPVTKNGPVSQHSAGDTVEHRTAPSSRERSRVAARPTEVHCTCPVCQSDLQIVFSVEPKATRSNDGDQLAEHPECAFEPQASAAGRLSSVERERQIAAARKAHPVSLYSPIKPRLEQILSNGSSKVNTPTPSPSLNEE